ncbi:hypothetical protein [Rhodococcus opacus]
MVSFRLYTHSEVAGALNVLGIRAHAFDAESVTIGEVLAAHAAIAIFAVGADQAFAMLVTLSQESNTPVAVIAAKIIELGPEPREQHS